MSTPDLSLIVALYFEEECVEEYVKRVREEIDDADFSYEIVFVDDGSEDQTVTIVERIAAEDPRIKLIQLSRNYGKEVAVTAGIEHACGDYMLMMDVDLQDPPERIVDFWDKIHEGYDLVFGVRKKKTDSISNRLFSKIFWSFLNNLTGLQIPTDLAVMRIFNRAFAGEFLRFPERIRFIEGLFMSIGMRRTTLLVENHERFAGTSKFNFRRRLNLAVNAVLAFSNRPLELGVGFGLSLLAFTTAAGAYFGGRKLILGIGMQGWTSTTLFILMMGSVQIVMLGIIGAYLGRVYTEVKQRPIYSVQKRVNQDDE